MISLEKLEQYERDGLLRSQKHPSLHLKIWNYTERVQFENLWDDVTIQCRGLVTTFDGGIVARPFPKFFNLGQRIETQLENLPAELPVITAKLDGSLGIVFQYKGQWICATRGSFTSEQAQWGQAWLDKQDTSRWIPDVTYLFEIIYKANRIVVDYPDEGLILLAAINTKTGEELDAYKVGFDLDLISAELVGSSIPTLIELCKTMSADEEGFVLKYSNGLRVKMKGEEYLRLHRLLTQCSARRIWECLANGQSIDEWLQGVPDEFYTWVKATQEDLQGHFNAILWDATIAWTYAANLPTRKEQALYLKETWPNQMHIAFALLDGKRDEVAEIIWKKIRPEHELPFKLNQK